MPVTLGAAPQHGFDEPLGLLGDCHRRIEHFLSVLRRISLESAGKNLPDDYRKAAESALAYFRVAAPRHTDDEEQSLFPLLRASGDERATQALKAMEALEADHVAATAGHEEVDRLFRQWIDSGTLAVTPRLVQVLDELTRLYQRHLRVEDKELFPLAAQLLNKEQLVRLGNEMAARRGIVLCNEQHKPQGDAMTIKHTIDVRTIPGPQRHPLIFRTFEALEKGEALELVNDHDPFPLRSQFNMMKRGQFDWTYLQQGPELWRVRIGRLEAAPVQA